MIGEVVFFCVSWLEECEELRKEFRSSVAEKRRAFGLILGSEALSGESCAEWAAAAQRRR